MMPENEIVAEKLDKIINLLGIYLTKDLKGDEQVKILHRAGLSRQEISNSTGKEPNTVDQALHRIKQEKIPSDRKKAKTPPKKGRITKWMKKMI